MTHRLALDASVAAIRVFARRRRFLTYGDIAAASGATWRAVFRQVPSHLDNVCVEAHRSGWPLITAIVVEEENRETGDLGPDALAGFLKAVQMCGVAIGPDPRAFLRAEQDRTFAWPATW